MPVDERRGEVGNVKGAPPSEVKEAPAATSERRPPSRFRRFGETACGWKRCARSGLPRRSSCLSMSGGGRWGMLKGPHRAKLGSACGGKRAPEGSRRRRPRARSEVGNVKGAPPSEVRKRLRRQASAGGQSPQATASAQRGGEC